MDKFNSRVDVAYIYERLHDALNSDDLAREISELSSELAYNFHVDTGEKIGIALGWGAAQSRATKGETHMTKSKCAAMYRDWANNFLTLGRFAEYHGISERAAERVIEIGRKAHNREAATHA
jgi:hypothetical protein